MAISKKRSNSGFDFDTFKADLKLSIDRMNFPIEKQLEFIELLESFSTLKRQDALNKLCEVYESEFGKKAIQIRICKDLIYFSSKGNYDAGLEKWFDKKVLFLYRVASYTEDRSSVVDIITQDLSQESKLFRQSFISKMIMPLALILILTVAIVAVYTMILPMFVELFDLKNPYEHVPVAVKYIGIFCVNYSPIALVALIAGRIGYVRVRNNWVGQERDKWSQYFPFIIFRSFQSAKLLKVISLMKRSDMKLLDVLIKLEKWVDPYLRWHVRRMIWGLTNGKDKESYFGIGLLSSTQLIRLRAQMQESNETFSDALMLVAGSAYKDAESVMKKYSGVINKALYLLALVLGMLFLESFSALMLMIEV